MKTVDKTKEYNRCIEGSKQACVNQSVCIPIRGSVGHLVVGEAIENGFRRPRYR
jgi:hypothetical protein